MFTSFLTDHSSSILAASDPKAALPRTGRHLSPPDASQLSSITRVAAPMVNNVADGLEFRFARAGGLSALACTGRGSELQDTIGYAWHFGPAEASRRRP